MAVTTDLEIANFALGKLGQEPITTLTAAVRDAQICNRFYTQNKEYCLTLLGVSLGTTIANFTTVGVELMSARLSWLISGKICGDDTYRNRLNQEWLLLAAQATSANPLWVRLLNRIFGAGE